MNEVNSDHFVITLHQIDADETSWRALWHWLLALDGEGLADGGRTVLPMEGQDR